MGSDQVYDVVAVVDDLLRGAASAGASDVHFEPTGKGLVIKYRLDGSLSVVEELPQTMADNVISRLKVLGGLLTYRNDIPQEGRIDRRDGYGDDVTDQRLAVFPTIHGQRAVVRFFYDEKCLTDLDELGLPEVILASIKRIAASQGLLLLTGPAGSGKSTTLAALLRYILKKYPGKSIVTLEDPVERRIEGVTQVQILPHGRMTFPVALRSLLRQDPEVLMIGEITALGSDGTAHVNDGDNAVCGQLSVGAGAGLESHRGTGHLKIHDGGTFTQGNYWCYVGASGGRAGTITQDGGTSSFGAQNTYSMHLGATYTGTLNLSGGTMTFSDKLMVSAGATGIVNHTGGTLTAGRLQIPRYLVNGNGTYNISGTAVLSVTNELLLGGAAGKNGTLNITGPDATIDADTFNQGSAGTLHFTAGSGFSTIVVAGAAAFDGTLIVDGAGITSPQVLMSFGSSSGTFATETLDLPTGYYAEITGGGNAGVLQVVPEPATLALLGIGGLGVLIRRRRK